MRAARALVAAVTLTFVLGANAPSSAQPADERALDAGASKASFTIAHIFVSRVTGSVPIVSGSIALAHGDLIPTSVDAVLDATKVRTGDADRDASLAPSRIQGRRLIGPERKDVERCALKMAMVGESRLRCHRSS